MVMSFDPARFLAVANDLASQASDEGRLRTAVGRAYYSVFLLAREKTGVPNKRNVHSRSHAALKRMSGCRAAGDMLAKLNRPREVADYQLLPSDPVDRDWIQNWSNAKQLANLILPKVQ